ncbi:MAG: hypothetical protein JXR07_15820 [Reichenbachiella sp.]
MWLLSSHLGIGQEKRRTEGKPFIRNFTPKEYDGESQNWDFYQGKEGLIYVANTGGILEYDGVKWRSFRPTNDGIPLTFSGGPDTFIYVGGTNFIGYLAIDSLGYLEEHSLMEKLPKNYDVGYIRSAYSHDNKVFFSNAHDVIVWDGDTFEVIKSEFDLSMLLPSRDGILVGTSKGVYDLRKEGLKKTNWTYQIQNVRKIIPLKSKQEVICSYSDGVYIKSGNEIERLKGPVYDFLKESYIQNAMTLPNGELCFATKKSGVLITDQSFNPIQILNKSTGLQDDDVKNVFMDRQNNLWLANNRGVSRIDYPFEFSYFDVIEEKLGTVEEIEMFQDDIYLGTFMGTFRLNTVQTEDLLSINPLPTFDVLPGSSVENFALEGFGEYLFFGGDVLSVYDGNSSWVARNRSPRKLLKSALNPDILYAGYGDGFEVLKINIGQVSNVWSVDLPASEYRGIAETPNGDLWLCTLANGVFFIDMDQSFDALSVKHYNKMDGLPSERDNLVYNVHGEIFFTTHQGIFKFDSLSQRFKTDRTFGIEYTDPSRFVYSFNHNGGDRVWLNSYNLRETGLAEKMADGLFQLNLYGFEALNDMQVYDILEDENGVVWFGGSDGLARYEKSDSDFNQEQYNSKVRKVVIAGDRVVFGGHKTKSSKAIFKPYYRDVRFEVAALTYKNTDRPSFQYMLEGYESEWSNWTEESFRVYTNLSEGDYRFKVRARLANGALSEGDEYAFVILPFWFETWIFRYSMIAIIGTFLYLMISFFSKRKLIKKVEEMDAIRRVEKEKDEALIIEKKKGIQAMIEAQEEERQRIAKDLHDGIVQEIGSNIIQWRNLFSKDKVDTNSAIQLINSLENSNGELRALSHQMMPKALSAIGVVSATAGLLETSLEPAGIQYEYEDFGINERLPEAVEIPLYRIAQELIQNIIKHSQAKHVNIQLYKAGDFVNLIVEDNGIGMDEGDFSAGIGLQNIKSRLDPLNGSVNFEQSPQKGTLVTIKIPL